ncbi:MAG: hypothetical protein ACYCQJ_14305 [Nitrososphaerales archaeon]
MSCLACGRKQKEACSIAKNRQVTGCCYCLDKRTERQSYFRYLDGIGDLNTSHYGIPFPRDIAYCPACRVTTISTSELDIDLAKTYLRRHPELCQMKWAQDLMEDDPYLFVKGPLAN